MKITGYMAILLVGSWLMAILGALHYERMLHQIDSEYKEYQYETLERTKQLEASINQWRLALTNAEKESAKREVQLQKQLTTLNLTASGLRHTNSSLRSQLGHIAQRVESLPALAEAALTLDKLLDECTESYRELGIAAAGHAEDVRTYLDWRGDIQ
jgi:chromosome segregation ATPase